MPWAVPFTFLRKTAGMFYFVKDLIKETASLLTAFV
jgi:hypothetical protein